MQRNRDVQIARHIIGYCHEVEEALLRFGKDKETFLQDAVFRNACAMPLMQIGELAKKFSDAFIAEHDAIPWKAVKGMRTIFAHDYQSMDRSMIWDTAVYDTPAVKQVLEEFLRQR